MNLTRSGGSEPITLDSVERLDVRPGDTVVLKLATMATADELAEISHQMKSLEIDGARFMILGPGMDITVVGPE